MLFLALAGGAPPALRADASLLLHEAIGVSGEETSAGHSSVHFSRLCPDGPLRLRWCQPGELGAVVSTYPEFGTDRPYEWLAVPFRTYLYGVEQERQVPIYTNGEIRTMLRRQNGRELFPHITIPDEPKPGRWREVIAVTFNRDIYSFKISTTAAEDARVMAYLNNQPNQSTFQTTWNNCADFTRRILNLYFPRAIHRDWVNDFTMTTPKAIARSLTSYAKRHRSERKFSVEKYSQLAGPIRRSLDNRKFSEWAFRSKKYIIPQALFKPELLAIFGTTYHTLGYFNPHGEYEKSLRNAPPPTGQASAFSVTGESSTVVPAAPDRGPTWAEYRRMAAPRLQRAIDTGLFADRTEVKTFFRDLELQSEPSYDSAGELMLNVDHYGQRRQLGLTPQNLEAGFSDTTLAYKLMLAKAARELDAREKDRRRLPEFAADWRRLLDLESRHYALPASSPATPALPRPRFRAQPEQLTFGKRFKKFFLLVSH